ncbi:helix-turn-helix domain-containing protein [Staphylococcus aureus]|uniref:helix-turn-helix domain-containing protein n=1 Tax=Staphylococcus aureus TaxID=1280 RepID=UPI0004507514|nr:hypothetical protein [Staphylococcus aureus]EZX73052.1 hypothetical protein V110_02763 [Staphylococcus aureus Chi-8]HDE8373953.1 hypothetical protein [Staphylococcus aureus]HDG4884438.1 hypothetical protein [Staphylococcus aureus]HDK3864910.1 hypothetical protein [Staphylococcus aureus]HEO8820559.1 hypothetical protein [Staphylococcus aureus]
MNSINDVIQTINKLLNNKDIKLQEISDNTDISRSTLSLLKHGQKDIKSLTISNAEKLYDFAEMVDNGGYVRNKTKQRSTKKSLNSREYRKLTPKQIQKLEEHGIDRTRYYARKNDKWSLKDALESPVRKKRAISDEERTILKNNGIKESTFNARISRGWDRQRALNTKT